MNKSGWLVNDTLSCIPGVRTFWHDLLGWFPKLQDKTNGYTDYSVLADSVESLNGPIPEFIIRNGSYFRRLNINVPTIALIQDCTPCLFDQQLDIINNSRVVVFNTNYVYNKYINRVSDSVSIKICPLGIDFDFFKPSEERHHDVLCNSIIFIGDSNNFPKGFNVVLEIIDKMSDQNFCLIMKDDYAIHQLPENIRHRVRIFNRVNTETVKLIINSCVAAICTSYEETQHLSGIECAACNIPIIAREVGVYYDNRHDATWGLIADDSNFVEKIQFVLNNIHIFQPRKCFIEKYSTEICRQNWIEIIESL